jgi:hypothetical protein
MYSGMFGEDFFLALEKLGTPITGLPPFFSVMS